MQVRDGPAAVRGVALRWDSHWGGTLWEGGGRGCPKLEDLPVALLIQPLAEGGFVLHRLIVAATTALASLALALGASASGTNAQAFPHRIVSISPTSTESLFAIGAGSQVVAVDSQSDYPKDAPITKLSAFTPNVEAIANYKPDLVILSLRPRRASSPRWQKLEHRVRHASLPPSTLEKQAYAEMLQPRQDQQDTRERKTRLVGIAQGTDRENRSLPLRYESRHCRGVPRAPRARICTRRRPTMFIGKILRLLRPSRNIADAADSTNSPGYPQPRSEYVVAANPST